MQFATRILTLAIALLLLASTAGFAGTPEMLAQNDAGTTTGIGTTDTGTTTGAGSDSDTFGGGATGTTGATDTTGTTGTTGGTMGDDGTLGGGTNGGDVSGPGTTTDMDMADAGDDGYGDEIMLAVIGLLVLGLIAWMFTRRPHTTTTGVR